MHSSKSASNHCANRRNILPYAAFYASVAGLSLGYLWVNRSTLVPKARQATQWLREVSADFAQIHVIEPVKNIYTELVYREHYTLGKAETIKRQLEHSQQQFQKVFALWQNAAKVSMVSRHDVGGIWVAFFSRCQRYRC